MQKPTLFGADYSVYVRAVRLALHEKGVDYDLVPVDVFADAGAPPSYLARQPFGRIPSFEHEGFRIYETGAITRYIDEAFEGLKLQPADARHRARVNQIIGIADSYVYPTLVWGVYVESVEKPARGEATDEARLLACLSKAPVILEALASLTDECPWLVGASVTLADLHLAPMVDCFLLAHEGQRLIERHEKLAAWWPRMKARPSMAQTQPIL